MKIKRNQTTSSSTVEQGRKKKENKANPQPRRKALRSLLSKTSLRGREAIKTRTNSSRSKVMVKLSKKLKVNYSHHSKRRNRLHQERT